MSGDGYSSSEEGCSDALRDELLCWLDENCEYDRELRDWDLVLPVEKWAPLQFRVELCKGNVFRLFPCYLGADFWVVTSVDDLRSVLYDTKWLDLWRTALADL
jgi:hypothetical protein